MNISSKLERNIKRKYGFPMNSKKLSVILKPLHEIVTGDEKWVLCINNCEKREKNKTLFQTNSNNNLCRRHLVEHEILSIMSCFSGKNPPPKTKKTHTVGLCQQCKHVTSALYQKLADVMNRKGLILLYNSIVSFGKTNQGKIKLTKVWSPYIPELIFQRTFSSLSHPYPQKIFFVPGNCKGSKTFLCVHFLILHTPEIKKNVLYIRLT